jgi:hypothetical protein
MPSEQVLLVLLLVLVAQEEPHYSDCTLRQKAVMAELRVAL